MSRGRDSSFNVFRALVQIMGRADEGSLPLVLPNEEKNILRTKIHSFHKTEIIELLHFVGDEGYERGAPALRPICDCSSDS